MEIADSDLSDTSACYSIIAQSVKAEIKIKGSRFISHADFVENKDQCEKLIASYHKNYHDATHVCYAYRFGIGENSFHRYSDAGEPNGSAGMPIFNVIKGVSVFKRKVFKRS